MKMRARLERCALAVILMVALWAPAGGQASSGELLRSHSLTKRTHLFEAVDHTTRLGRSPGRKRQESGGEPAAGAKRQAPDLTRVVAVSGQTIELQCPLGDELPANDEQTIQWRKDGLPLTQMNSTRLRLSRTNSSSSLTIVDAQPLADESTFECMLAAAYASQSTEPAAIGNANVHQFQLKLLVPPRLAPFEFPRDVQVGMKVLLTCSALEGQQPISFVWLKDGKVVVPQAAASSGQQHGQPADESNSDSSPSDASELDSATRELEEAPSSLAHFHQQQLADKFALSAHAPASLGHKSAYVLIQPGAKAPSGSDISGEEGAEPAALSADKKTAQASKGGSKQRLGLKSGASMQLIDASVKIRQADDYSILSIDSIELKHAGRYTCSAQNEAARTSHSSQLVINAPAQLTTRPRDGDLVSGQSLVIECAASGQPRPTVSWLRARESNGGKLDLVPIYENLRYSILPNGSLAISNATQREQGYYMCTARNGFGPEASKLVKVTVHEPARVSARYKLVEARLDEKAQLTCEASGELPVALSWLDKDGRQIDQKSSDKRFIIDNKLPSSDNSSSSLGSSASGESSLVITRTIRADSGHYTCQASNKFGQDKMVAQLLVQDVPERVSELKVVNATASTISLRWQLGFTGNAPVTSYLVQYQSDDPLDDLLLTSSTAGGSFADQTSSTMAPQLLDRHPADATLLQQLLAAQWSEQQQESSSSQSGTMSSLKAALDLLNSLASNSNDTNSLSTSNPSASSSISADEAIDRTLVELTVEQSATNLVVKDLSPFCVYRLRLAAINKIGLGEFSQWIRAKTEEAAPSGSALKIGAVATGPNSIKLTWSPPDRRTWNGQLVRFQIGYRPIDSTFELNKSIDWSPPSLMQSIMMSASNRSTTGSANGNSAASKSALADRGSPSALRQHLRQLLAMQQQELVAHLTNLQRSTNYLIWIQAVNSRGVGPQSHAISVKTLDDVPPSAPALRIQSTSPDSITIAWSMLSNFVSPANQYSLFYRRVPPPPISAPNQLEAHFYPRPLSNFSSVFADSVQAPQLGEPGPFIERTITSQQLLLASSSSQLQQQRSPFHQTPQQLGQQHYQQFVYTLDQLDCGSVYELYMTTRNSVGKSEPSPVVTTRTSGEPPLAPHNKNNLFARIGAQDVLLNLATWSTGGCPLTHVGVRYKQVPQPVASAQHDAAANSTAATVTGSPNFSVGWPVSASVPANLLASINQAHARATQRMPASFADSAQPAPASAKLLGGDQISQAPGGQYEAQFALKNLQPSTGYELEISAHNAAGHTTAQYEFVTAGANGSRSGYTRREGVFRLDQRGQPVSLNTFDTERQGAPSFAADNRINLFPSGHHTNGHPSGVSLSNQLAPLMLTLLCLVCLVTSAAFCYQRLSDSWKHSGGSRRDSMDTDAMRSVCGDAASTAGANSTSASSKSLFTQNWARSNGLKHQRGYLMNGRPSQRQQHHHATLVDQQLVPSTTSADSPQAAEHQQQLYQQHYCSREPQAPNHLINSTTLNPKSSLFSQSVSMKDFNLIPPLGSGAGAATLNFSARHQRSELSKIGASATMARGRLFEQPQTPVTYGLVAGDDSRICPASAVYGTCSKHPKQAPYTGGVCQGLCQAELEQPTNETSWTTSANAGTNYAIPANTYQNYANAGEQSGEHGYPCAGYTTQGNIDACIQQLISHQEQQQQQYSTLLLNQQKQDASNQCSLYDGTNHTDSGQTFGQQPQLTATSFGTLVPQSVIESSSSSSGIGADFSTNLHLECNSSSGVSNGEQVGYQADQPSNTSNGSYNQQQH